VEESVLIIALAGAFYPALIGVVVLLLPRERAGRLLSAFLAGGLTTTITIGLLIVFGLGSTSALEGENKHTLGAGAEIVFGAIALLSAALIARGGLHRGERDDGSLLGLRRPKPRTEESEESGDSWTTRALSKDSLAIAFLAGCVLNLPSVWYLAALKLIIEGDHSALTNVLLVVGYNLIAFCLVEIPLILYAFSPDRSKSLVERLQVWLKDHKRQLAVLVSGGLGLFLLIRGISNLS
jgi:Sap-like sulfolipid-1-addressing protein